MATRLLRATVVAGAAAWAAAGTPANSAPPRVEPGVFLYAAPSLGDPNFFESVVFILEHGAGGSLGLIVNRPTRVGVREAVKELAETRGLDLRVYEGGPVQPEARVALVRSPRALPDAWRVLPDVQLSTQPRQWREIAGDAEAASRLRVYAGYAGWGPGQLASEMRLGSWIVTRADARSIFSSEPSALWPRVHELMRRIEARARITAAAEAVRPAAATDTISRRCAPGNPPGQLRATVGW
jgi:putative transcriptional regulator